MYTNLFCSILSQAAATGSFSVQLTSLNASANVTLTLTATGNTVGMAPDDMSANAVPQMITQLIQYAAAYDGAPALSQDTPAATWRVMFTDHIITFFSECQFRLKLLSNDTGAEIVCTHEPLLVTLDDLTTYSNLMKLGATLTTDEQILLITTASGLITAYLNNLLVLAGYVKTETGFYQRSFWLNQGLPVQSWDPPRIAPPGIGIWYNWLYLMAWVRWNMNPETGELFYQPNQNFLNVPEPGSLNYQVKVSYTAGLVNLPAQVLIAMTTIIKAIVNDMGGAKSLKTGSFQVTLKERTPILEALAMLDDFKLQ